MKRLSASVVVAVLMSFGLIVSGVDNTAESEGSDEALIVKNWKGKYIGSAQHVLLDSSTGNITFIILELSRGKKEIAVPLTAFSSYNHENRTFILGVSEEVLISAPEFHVSDLRDPAFLEKVYRFFGEAPPWTDRGRERKSRM